MGFSAVPAKISLVTILSGMPSRPLSERSRIIFLFFFVAVPVFGIVQDSVGNNTNPGASTAPKEVIEWFRRAALPLNSINPKAPLEELRPLQSMVGDAHIVAMGEATHGTHEFFELKHRVFEFLVKKMGFTVFAIEANWPESLAINDYVLNGNGDPVTGLAGMYFWTWNTEEVLDMILWMRQYNEDNAHTRKLKFFGFDMQTARVAVANVESYLRNVDQDGAKLAEDILDPLSEETKEHQYSAQSSEVKSKTRSGIALLLKRFDEQKEIYIARSTSEEWALAQHNLEIVEQAEQLYSAGRSGAALRDRFMAADAKWILDHEAPGTKMMIWAHNGHVSDVRGSMGNFLRLNYGRDMLICGFSFDEGSFQAKELPPALTPKRLREFSVSPAIPDSLDSALAATGIPMFVVDLRGSPAEGVISNWLNSAHPMRSIGAAYSELNAQNFYVHISPRVFDVIFFVNQTSSSHENPPTIDMELPTGWQ